MNPDFPARPWSRPFLPFLALLTLSACGGTPATPAPSPSPNQPAPEQVRISGQVVLPQGALAAGVTPQSLPGSPSVSVGEWDAPHVPGELLVSSGGLSAQALSTQLAGLRSESLSSLGLVRVWTPQPEELAQQLAAQGIASQPNYLYTAQAVPNDPGFPGGAGISVGQARYHQDYLNQIGAATAWQQLRDQGKSLEGVRTAVLDTGVDRSHPDLAGRIAGGTDFCSVVQNNSCVGTDADYSDILTEPAGHGTAMTGLIGAATNNGQGLSGMTWSGPLLAVKVLGDQQGGSMAGGSTASLAQGLNYAIEQGARVINMSLGLRGLDNDPVVHQQLQRAAAADILMISAAGNTAGDGLYFPANQPEVMAVGAVSPTGQMSCFSARPKPGQTLELLAPGGEYGCNRPTSQLLELTRGGYQLGLGTSEASALTSGAASLIRAAYPNLKAEQVRQALVRGGRPTDSAQPQLNLPGALAAAQALADSTPPAPVPPTTPKYDLTVQAYQNGQQVGAPFHKEAQPLSSLSLPYELNLPRGSYELRVQVITTKGSYRGAASVNAQAETALNISVR